MENERLYLNYELTLPDGQKFYVEEYPEYTGKASNTNRTGLVRTFTLKGAPTDIEIFLHLSCPHRNRFAFEPYTPHRVDDDVYL